MAAEYFVFQNYEEPKFCLLKYNGHCSDILCVLCMLCEQLLNLLNWHNSVFILIQAYLSILYLKPRMQIFLRKEKVKTVVIRKSLSKTEVDLYKPIKYKQIKIVFGFSQNINHYGIMMYHRNRLIKPYVRVGCQLKVSQDLYQCPYHYYHYQKTGEVFLWWCKWNL